MPKRGKGISHKALSSFLKFPSLNVHPLFPKLNPLFGAERSKNMLRMSQALLPPSLTVQIPPLALSGAVVPQSAEL